MLLAQVLGQGTQAQAATEGQGEGVSVVRLELTVKDEDAEGIAAELAEAYCGPVQDSPYSWSGATRWPSSPSTARRR